MDGLESMVAIGSPTHSIQVNIFCSALNAATCLRSITNASLCFQIVTAKIYFNSYCLLVLQPTLLCVRSIAMVFLREIERTSKVDIMRTMGQSVTTT